MIDIPYDPMLKTIPSYTYPPGDLTLKCGNGHTASLSNPNHTVDAAGVVVPSVVCPDDGCAWHETVRLLDWPPPRPVKPERPGVGGLLV